MDLILKSLSECKNYIGTAHEFSKDFHKGLTELLGGVVQRNVIYGNVCRDMSYFLFHVIEQKKLWIIFKSVKGIK